MKQLGINPVLVLATNAFFGEEDSNIIQFGKAGSDDKVVKYNSKRCIDSALQTETFSKAGACELIESISKLGGYAVGISGRDARFIEARKLRSSRRFPHSNISQILQSQHSGEVISVTPDLLAVFEDSDIIPIISPIGSTNNSKLCFLDSRDVASAIAVSIAADKLIIMEDWNFRSLCGEESKVSVNMSKVERCLRANVDKVSDHISLEILLNAIRRYAGETHIIDSRTPNALFMGVFADENLGVLISDQECVLADNMST
jgi:acetylglutamate kinase